MADLYLTDIHVVDIEKRYVPSKHYVYSIWVTWSDNSKHLIYRRYSEFFDLQCKLLNKFEDEAGVKNPTNRIIPFLPGKIIFKRSAVRSVALDRLHPINIYCKKLITLKKEISHSKFVIDFFHVNANDINRTAEAKNEAKKNIKINGPDISEPIKTQEYICVHDFKAYSKNELSLKKNTKCYVVEKNLNGWWFASSDDGQGYVPQCVIAPLFSNTQTDEQKIQMDKPLLHVAGKDYNAKREDELSFKKGDFFYVYEKNFNGWWLAKSKLDNKTGKVPAVYIQQVNEANIPSHDTFSIPAFDLFPLSNIFKIAKPIVNSQFDSNQNPDSNIIRNYNENQAEFLAPIAQDSENFENFPDIYYAIEDYVDEVGDGVNLIRGKKVVVQSRDENTGWWYVLLDNIEGWAPSAYLSKSKPPPPPRPKPPAIFNTSKANFFTNSPSLIDNLNIQDLTESLQPDRVSELKKIFENN